MADLAQLQTWRAALQAARFNGTRTVEYDGRKVEYRTDAELRQAIADVEREINQANGGRITCVRIASSKGL